MRMAEGTRLERVIAFLRSLGLASQRITALPAFRWWTRRELNSHRPACEAGALPIELRAQIGGGREGRTPKPVKASVFGTGGLASYDRALRADYARDARLLDERLEALTGIEPAPTGLRSRRSAFELQGRFVVPSIVMAARSIAR